MKRSKYRNIPTVVDGIRFASKAEAKRYGELKLLERAGEINLLVRQPRFKLEVAGRHICTYVGDFGYTVHDRTMPSARRAVVEDRKGFATDVFKIKWALAQALYPQVDWRIVGSKRTAATAFGKGVKVAA